VNGDGDVGFPFLCQGFTSRSTSTGIPARTHALAFHSPDGNGSICIQLHRAPKSMPCKRGSGFLGTLLLLLCFSPAFPLLLCCFPIMLFRPCVKDLKACRPALQFTNLIFN